ncbi:MAG: vWA domain-containing protein [Ilumatobacteraceae bacterium]
MDNNSLHTSLSFDRDIVAIHEDDVVHLLVDLTASESSALERPAVDAVFVLDRSGSMAGDPLDAVKAACDRVVGMTDANDRIGIVTFDSTVDVVLQLDRHDTIAARRAISRISARGMTNLSAGWLKALDMLNRSPRQDAIRRIIILTDGHANEGLTDRDALAGMVAGGRTHGVTTSVIGFGDGYDEVLAGTLANQGGGNDYWCAGPDNAPEVFDAEFGGLAQVAAQNITIDFMPSAQVAVCEVLNDFRTAEHADGTTTIDVGDIYASETRSVVIRLSLRPVLTTGAVHVGDLNLSWAAIGDQMALHSVSLPVDIRADVPGAFVRVEDSRVREQILILEAARSERAGRDAAQAGDLEQAATYFTTAANFLTQTSLPDTFSSSLRSDADALTKGIWSDADSKRRYSSSRESSKGRRSKFDDSKDNK